MKEILFKGFHPYKNGTTEITLNGEKINGEWIEGLPFGRIDGGLTPHGINSLREDKDGKVYSVFPETVKEYVNLMDCEFNKIFNGDLLKGENGKIWLMTYAKGWWSYQIVSQNTKVQDHCTIQPITHTDKGDYLPSMKIVGNKWENPELLKKD